MDGGSIFLSVFPSFFFGFAVVIVDVDRLLDTVDRTVFTAYRSIRFLDHHHYTSRFHLAE